MESSGGVATLLIQILSNTVWSL